jgi:deoxyribodipyrimidine photo-lyase
VLGAQGIRLVRIRRDWDSRSWPHATAGFFKLKAGIPKLIAGLD